MDVDDCLMRPGERKVGLVERRKPKKKMSQVRDSGWAWVVAIAAMLINFIMAGLGRMSGILYVAFIERFDISRREATVPFSIRSSTRNLLGPVVGILGQQYGVRAVTLAGGIMGAMSAAACYFAPNMLWITVIWGGINGVSTALTTTLPQVVIAQYFEKHYTTASGMTFSGGCIGSFVFPVILEYLLYTYDIQGTFLIIAGIIMNAIPAAMILQRPPWLSDESPDAVTEDDHPEVVVVNGVPGDVAPDVSLNGSVVPCHDLVESKKERVNGSSTDCPSDGNCNKFTTEEPPDIVSDLKHLGNSSEHSEDLKRSISRQEESSITSQSHEGGGFIKHIKTAFMLYGDPMFLLICCCRAVHFMTFVPVITVIVDFGMDKGLLEADGKYIIAALSAGDLIGRLGLGWVTDKKFVSLRKYMLVVMIIQGLSTACLPLLYNRVGIMLLIAVFGLLQGSVFVRHTVLVSRYMCDDVQSIAMGSINFLSGLLGFALPYVIGFFRDYLGSYDYMLFATGAIGSATGALWFLEPQMVKHSKKYISEKGRT